MSFKFDLIRDIVYNRVDWSFKVKVVRLWEVPSHFNADELLSVEMVFMDEKGDRIQATVKRVLLKKFKNLMTEGKVYHVKGFVVGENHLTLKPTSHQYRLHFTYKTTVMEISSDEIPLGIFNFRNFEDINSSEHEILECFDIIGLLEGKDEAKEHYNNGKLTSFMEIRIQDPERNFMSVTLWGDMVGQLMTFLNSAPSFPIIVLLQFAVSRRYKGEVGVRNSFFISKLYLNCDLKEMDDLKHRFEQLDFNFSSTINQLSQHVYSSGLDELVDGSVQLRKISELFDDSLLSSVWVLGTILAFEEENGWYYQSCKKCPKKIEVIGRRFYCSKCDRIDFSATYRYRIQLRVVDDSGSASFTLWDREGVKILGCSAKDAKDSEVTVLDDDVGSYPKLLETLIGKTMLFKVVNAGVGSVDGGCCFNIVKLSDDSSIIDKVISSHAAKGLTHLHSSNVVAIHDVDCKEVSPNCEVVAESVCEFGLKRSFSGESVGEGNVDNVFVESVTEPDDLSPPIKWKMPSQSVRKRIKSEKLDVESTFEGDRDETVY